ncbi:MAG: helix-turn-helix domain-containing protein, partial [Lachnospiraceae bacterium]|nr:helix-turn-helix domain-containing protein [Lachnospiraceae bacterium]
ALAGKNIMLDGEEGSGKRTAVRELCAQIPSKSKVLYFTNSRFAKDEIESNLKKPNVSVEYYSGFAFRELRKIGIYGETESLLEIFAKVKPAVKSYDWLIVAEFEDMTYEASQMLEIIKSKNPNIKIIAFGDVSHMVSEPGVFNPRLFMETFLDNYIKIDFRNCYVILSYDKDMRDSDAEDDYEDEPSYDEDSFDEDKEEAPKEHRKRQPLGTGHSEAKTPENKIAVIDTEINRRDEVMSIGIVIGDATTFEPLEEKYFIIEPEHAYGGDNSKFLRINEYVNVDNYSRKNAINTIKNLLKADNIRSIFAYNATSEYECLAELSSYNWYDIMQVAAFRQYNHAITDDDECHESGRLKRDFDVASMINRLSGDNTCTAARNAVYDARDELKVMKLLKRPIGDYRFTRVSDSDVDSDIDWQDIAGADADIGEDALTAAEAEELLGVSRGTVYNLIKRGDIFGYKRGQRYIVSEASVREYMEKQEAAENFRYKTTVFAILLAIFFALIYLMYIASGIL